MSVELLAKAHIYRRRCCRSAGRMREGEVFARKALPFKRKISDLAAVSALLSGIGVAASAASAATTAALRRLEDSLECLRSVDCQLGVAFVFAFLQTA